MPSPDEISWIKMEGSIPEDKIQIRYDPTTNVSTLQIKRLEYSDEGTYYCTASTGGVKKSVSIYLRVVGKFMFVAASI